MSEDDEWELAPENSHTLAARLLTDEFYWDCTDDNSPFGNDTGADTLAAYRVWRGQNSRSSPDEFLDELLEGWEVANESWDVTDPAEVRRLLEEDEYILNVRDDAVIALAFGQLVLVGEVGRESRRRALLALQRQSLLAVIEQRGWVDAVARAARLAKMARVLGGV